MNNISITFRHVDPSEAIKSYAGEKIAKLQRFLRQPMTARVTLSLDALQHTVEVRLSSGSEHLEAHEASEDMYVSIDRVVHKLERLISASKGSVQSRQRRSGTLRDGSGVELVDEI